MILLLLGLFVLSQHHVLFSHSFSHLSLRDLLSSGLLALLIEQVLALLSLEIVSLNVLFLSHVSQFLLELALVHVSLGQSMFLIRRPEHLDPSLFVNSLYS